MENSREDKSAENKEGLNFYEVAQRRRDLRQELKRVRPELDNQDPLLDRAYKEPLAEVEEQASRFKIADFKKPENSSGLRGAIDFLKGQKASYEKSLESETSPAIAPELAEVLRMKEIVKRYKEFRLRRMLEILDRSISPTTRKRNESILRLITEEIKNSEEALQKMDLPLLRQAELLGYKEDLARSGHICITPSVAKDLEAIGDRMLTGKPILLHGPTGTGKTSLARFATAHFMGKDPEMVFCNPQTKQSDVYGKTGLRAVPGGEGAIETVEIYGPLARAMIEGKPVIFDEFTALPKEQMVFIKGIFNAKIGDKINISGNGVVEIKPGFQMIFTANLKSEKNPERQDLPPEIAREFEQNNLEIKYNDPAETYDIILSRLLGKDDSLELSFFDLNTTLPKLCEAMSEIQESYTNETDKEVARRAGAMDASGKVYSLKKFVMTQGSIEAILSSWLVEKQTGKKERSFSEFLDERLKTALTFKEYPKEDRILAAKILASKGFLLTLTAKDLDLPEDIFSFNTIRQMRGEDATEELKNKSGDVKRLNLREVAELDPFNKRANMLRQQAEDLLGLGDREGDPFLSDFDRAFGGVFAGEKKGIISTPFTYTNPDTNQVELQETITLDLEAKLQSTLAFYQSINLDIPPDFEDQIRDIWSRHQDEIEQAIATQGFNDLLLLPPTPNLPDLANKTEMEQGYWTSDNFTEGGGFAQAKSQNTNQTRLLLVHHTQNLQDHPLLKQTLNIKGQDVNLSEALTLEDYLLFQRQYFAQNNKHLDEDGWTWLATHSGPRLVCARWFPGDHRLRVDAGDLTSQDGYLGVRPTRCFL